MAEPGFCASAAAIARKVQTRIAPQDTSAVSAFTSPFRHSTMIRMRPRMAVAANSPRATLAASMGSTKP